MLQPLTDHQRQQVADFIQATDLEFAIERVEENPMGPPAWQDTFIHYALWFRSETNAIALYFSIQADAQFPEWLLAEALDPRLPFILCYMGKTIRAMVPDFDMWCIRMGYPNTDNFFFYYRQLERRLYDLTLLFPGETWDAFLALGG